MHNEKLPPACMIFEQETAIQLCVAMCVVCKLVIYLAIMHLYFCYRYCVSSGMEEWLCEMLEVKL